jgi:hypothetical protein
MDDFMAFDKGSDQPVLDWNFLTKGEIPEDKASDQKEVEAFQKQVLDGVRQIVNPYTGKV